MKPTKLLYALVALIFALGLSNCTTTYDAYGRPVQSVDPGLATAGIIGAGVIGYALADDNDHHGHHNHHGGGHHGHHGGHGHHGHHR